MIATGHAVESGDDQDLVTDALDLGIGQGHVKGTGGQDPVTEIGRGVGVGHEKETGRGVRGANHTLQLR